MPSLGVVADDVTGAVDLAGAVAAVGNPTTVHLGVPPPSAAQTRPAPGAAPVSCDVIGLTTTGTAPVQRAAVAVQA